jgi:phosphoglycolate phosphatase
MANLIFDYDGTLNNCLKTYRPAFTKAYKYLVDNKLAEPKEFSDRDISYWLGFTGAEMWATFQPDLPLEIREYCRSIISDETDFQVQNGTAELFPYAEDVLAQLKESGHTLIFLSNCRRRYYETHNKNFGLDRYFDYVYCAEDFGFIPKYEIFRRFRNNHIGDFIVIGDRFHDIETAVKNNLKSIGCTYGYGSADELKDADIKVDSVRDIPDAVLTLCGK